MNSIIRSRARLSRFGVVLIAVVAIFAMPSYAQDSTQIVEEVRFEGMYSYSESSASMKMKTREGQLYSRAVLDEDIQRLSSTSAFSNIQVFTEDGARGGVIVIVRVSERPLISRVDIIGNTKLKRSEFDKGLKSVAGAFYDEATAEKDAILIRNTYQENAYLLVDVTSVVEPVSGENAVHITFNVKENNRVCVGGIRFHGNNKLDDDYLKKVMKTKEKGLFNSGVYTQADVDEDIKRLHAVYRQDGYLDAKVSMRPLQVTKERIGIFRKARQLFLDIDVAEGEQYFVRSIVIKGLSIMGEDELKESLKSKEGGVFSPISAEEDVEAITEELGLLSKAFCKVRVTPQIGDGNTMDVVFTVEEGQDAQVQEIRFLGNTKTRDVVLRRDMTIFPGEMYDARQLAASKRRLHNLGFFSNVDIRVEEGTDPSKANIIVETVEQETGSLRFGVGFSSTESVLGSINLTQRNFDIRDFPKSWRDLLGGKAFVGDGQRLSLNLQAGADSSNYSLNFVEPWLYNKPIRLGVSLFSTSVDRDEYKEVRSGASLMLGRRIWNAHWDTSITYRIESVAIDSDSTSPYDIAMMEGEHTLSELSYLLQFDSRDSVFLPSRGFLHRVRAGVAGLGGDYEFYRAEVEANWYKTLFRTGATKKYPHIFHLRGRAGYVQEMGSSEMVPVSERFFAGGVSTVRGIDNRHLGPERDGDPIGGTTRVVVNAEYSFPLYTDVIRGMFFLDAGYVHLENDNRTESKAYWEDKYNTSYTDAFFDSQIDKFTSGGDMRYTAGFGLHIKTPLGPMPVQLYYAKILNAGDEDDNEEAFQFTFGTRF